MSDIDHRKIAVECFNGTWDLIDKKDRTEEENFEMLHKAHASRYHWGFVGKPMNFARGEWQISRVNSLLGLGESALFYGKRSLDIALKENLGGLDLAFGYESVARAYAVLGKRDLAQENVALGIKAAETMEDEDDRKYTLSELNNVLE